MIERSGTVFMYYLLDQKYFNQFDLESKIEKYYVNDFTKKRKVFNILYRRTFGICPSISCYYRKKNVSQRLFEN